MVRKDPEIEHSVGYNKHYYELFGEITDLILTALIKGTKNSLNNHFSKWWKYLIMHLGHLFFVVHRNLEPEEMNTSKFYYYEENQFITNEEKQQAIQQWPLCRQIVL